MGIYDREYYRGESTGSHWFVTVPPVCKAILLINVLVFVITWYSGLDVDRPEFTREYLAASPEYTLRNYRIWELLTATFLHAGPWHLFMNMLFLWVVGREMESMYGSKDFLAFYLCAAVISTLGWVLFDAAATRGDPHNSHVMVGASGAVMGVVMLFTMFYPKREMYFVFVPMPMWVIVLIYLVIPPLMPRSGMAAEVAWQSHATGAAFGWLYWYFDLRWSRIFAARSFRPRLRIFSPVSYDPARPRTTSSSRTSTSVGSGGKTPSVSVLPEEQLDARLDEVLAKIAREGRTGLTEEELRVLQEASRRARIRRSDRL